jgi:hypothetical protein
MYVGPSLGVGIDASPELELGLRYDDSRDPPVNA